MWKRTKSNLTSVAKWIVRMTIFILHRASRRIKRSAFGLSAGRTVWKIIYTLHHKPTITTRLGRQRGEVHSICTPVGPKHRHLRMGNWNVTSLNEKKAGLVWEAEQYHFDIVGVFSTKCRGSDRVELNEGWKLFYTGTDVTMSAQAVVGIFANPRLNHCVTDWIPLGGRVCLLKLRL